jgi:hypothetical protein
MEYDECYQPNGEIKNKIVGETQGEERKREGKRENKMVGPTFFWVGGLEAHQECALLLSLVSHAV